MKKKQTFGLKKELVLGVILAVFLQITGLPVLLAADTDAPTEQDKATITVRNDRTVLVDGQKAVNNGVVVSGAKIESGAGAEASINIPLMGSVKIFPNSELTVSFANKDINVKVERGCASIFTNDGFNGLITKPDGKTEATTPGVADEINSCDGDPGGGSGGGGGGGGGIGTLGLIGLLAAGGVVAIVILATQGDDASPMRP